jgi:SAM-dependent methyltransferase
MNEAHLQFLASPDWAQMLESELLPWLVDVADLGEDVLEVGPGPGRTTDLLRQRTARVTAVEIDSALAASLTARLAGTNVEVIHSDAKATGLPAGRFSAATCFSMLHHMESSEAQDRLFAEVRRVLRPGAPFVGIDSVDHDYIRDFHVNDVFLPIPPDELPARLEAAGFTDITVTAEEFQMRFVAH